MSDPSQIIVGVPPPPGAQIEIPVQTLALSGFSGYSGGVGGPGASGFSGYSGLGFSGPSGFSGYSAASPGPSGYSGYSGSGISGYSGYSGLGLSGYSGYSSVSGFSGYSGTSGATGGTGTSSFWNFRANTQTMADPGSGNIVANNVLMGSTTQLAFSKFDTAGTDRSSLFLASELNDQLLIQDQTNSANWIRYTITAVPTNNVTWFMVPVVTVTGSGTNPAQNDKLMVTFENTAGGSGYSGYSGIGLSGYSGYSGSGVSGYSGYSGPAGGGGTPGGSNTQVQYNNAGAFGGTSATTTNGSILTT